MSTLSVLQRFQQAVNTHDIEAFIGCFADDYRSAQPAHPDRGFGGKEQVHKNWTALFQSIPDIHADLLDSSVVGSRVWSEWDWRGTRTDGTAFQMAGVVILDIENDRIVSARLYMEPVEVKGAGIDANVRTMTNKQ
jgi:hypothetical protein